jgi:hypothetical protein
MKFEGNRSIVFDMADRLPEELLRKKQRVSQK